MRHDSYTCTGCAAVHEFGLPYEFDPESDFTCLLRLIED